MLAKSPAVVIGRAHVESSTKAATPFDDRQSYTRRQPQTVPLAPATIAAGMPMPNGMPTSAPTSAPDAPIGKVVETYAYYLNPLEWWAYSRDDHWPPSGKIAGIGWKRPAVRPFTLTRGE